MAEAPWLGADSTSAVQLRSSTTAAMLRSAAPIATATATTAAMPLRERASTSTMTLNDRFGAGSDGGDDGVDAGVGDGEGGGGGDGGIWGRLKRPATVTSAPTMGHAHGGHANTPHMPAPSTATPAAPVGIAAMLVAGTTATGVAGMDSKAVAADAARTTETTRAARPPTTTSRLLRYVSNANFMRPDHGAAPNAAPAPNATANASGMTFISSALQTTTIGVIGGAPAVQPQATSQNLRSARRNLVNMDEQTVTRQRTYGAQARARRLRGRLATTAWDIGWGRAVRRECGALCRPCAKGTAVDLCPRPPNPSHRASSMRRWIGRTGSKK